jgi:hypothetical protein
MMSWLGPHHLLTPIEPAIRADGVVRDDLLQVGEPSRRHPVRVEDHVYALLQLPVDHVDELLFVLEAGDRLPCLVAAGTRYVVGWAFDLPMVAVGIDEIALILSVGTEWRAGQRSGITPSCST